MSNALSELVKALSKIKEPKERDLIRLQKKYPLPRGYYSKVAISQEINRLNLKPSALLSKLLQLRPIRTLSGVTPVTVLTKPYPCPGDCIFCPSDVRMPKSYLSMEPGAQRAAHNRFDPYLQAYNRLQAFSDMGHSVAKIELLVLGGTWSVYPLAYRIWFVKRLFDALNDFGQNRDHRQPVVRSLTINLPKSPHSQLPYNQAIKSIYSSELNDPRQKATWTELAKAQRINETGSIRCVGLVLETRPDYLTSKEVLNLRRFGATKIQVGLQSLQDKVLLQNKRGHTVIQAAAALALLRLAGFKLHVHWMPNLYGSNPKKDAKEYAKLFRLSAFKPDEIKIYPTSLIAGTELMGHYQNGTWQPYSRQELLVLLSFCLSHTPRYCRISRMVRDIPGTDIVVGNKTTNFRQLAAADAGPLTKDIRAREIRSNSVDPQNLKIKTTRYPTDVSTEYFLEWVTDQDQIAGFLRLSLPNNPINRLTEELNFSAMIREVHVYGSALNLGISRLGKAQHLGLGKTLIQKAIKLSKQKGYKNLAVISAIGTREYYRKLGFNDGKLYQHYGL